MEEDKPEVKKTEDKNEHSDSLVENVTWRHYSFFIIHFIQSVMSAVCSPPMRQYLYAKLANKYIKNTTYAVNSTFDTGGNSLCLSKNASSERDHIQQQIQTETAMWTLYLNLAVGIPEILTWFYIGYLADRIGRKPMMILNNLAFVVRLTVYVIVIHWDLPTGYLMIGNFVDGFFGSYAGLNQLTNIYTADVTKKGKTRGFILTVVYAITDILYGSVNLLTGHLMKIFGFLGLIGASAIIMFTLNVMVYFLVPETLEQKTKLKDLSPTKGIKSVISFYQHKSDKGGGRTRLKFWLCLIAFTMVMQSSIGKWDVTPLFAMNSPLCWTSVELGHFNGGVLLIKPPVTIATLYVLQRFFSHEVITVFGLLSMISENLVLAFSSKSWMLYFSAFVGAPGPLTFSMLRTIVSHLTDPKEQGSVFAGLGTVEALCGMTSTAMLNTIYTQTVLWMKGFVFIVAAIFCFIPVILLLVLHIVNKREKKRQSNEISLDTNATSINDDPATFSPVVNTAIEPAMNAAFEPDEQL